MAYTSKTQALDAICRSLGGPGGNALGVQALNQWCVLVGATGGHVRNMSALNAICARLGAPAGHLQEVDALNAISLRLGGTGGHRRILPSLNEIAVLLAGSDGWAPGPVRLFGAGDSRFADGRQGTPPYDSGYILHRYSALNLAVWSLCGKVVHDARTDLFATAGCSLEQWIELHLPGLIAAVATAVNPLVLIHLGTHSLPWASLDDMQAQATALLAALTGAGARVLWLLENPRSGANALGTAQEGKRLAFNAWLTAGEGGFGGRFGTVDYLADYTADATATGGAARAGLQRDDLHDTQAGASVKAAAALARIAALPPVAAAEGYTGAPDLFDAATNPQGNRLEPVEWSGEVRDASDTAPGSGLTCAFATETTAGRTWLSMQLGGTGGAGDQARYYQAPLAGGYAGGDRVRYRVRVAWEDLVNVRAVKVIVFHYGSGFFGINTGAAGDGPAPSGACEEVLEGSMVLSAAPTFFQVKLMVEAAGPGPVSGTVRWADPELRRLPRG